MQHINKLKILSTGTLPTQLINYCEEIGFQIDVIPFIKIEPVPAGELELVVADLPLRPVTAVFTSNNAAEIVISKLHGHRPLWRLFCVGHTTRDTLTEYFGKDAVAAVASNAASLAKAIIRARNIREVVFFCGDLRREELPVLLSENKIHVKEVIVYKTVVVNNKITGIYNGILFFSPSAVDSFFANNTVGQETAVFAIGNTTAEILKKYTDTRIVTTEEPGKENLIAAMISFYKEKNQKKVVN